MKQLYIILDVVLSLQIAWMTSERRRTNFRIQFLLGKRPPNYYANHHRSLKYGYYPDLGLLFRSQPAWTSNNRNVKCAASRHNERLAASRCRQSECLLLRSKSHPRFEHVVPEAANGLHVKDISSVTIAGEVEVVLSDLHKPPSWLCLWALPSTPRHSFVKSSSSHCLQIPFCTKDLSKSHYIDRVHQTSIKACAKAGYQHFQDQAMLMYAELLRPLELMNLP